MCIRDRHYKTIEEDGKEIVAVDIQRGTDRPYYLAKKGMRPEGVYAVSYTHLDVYKRQVKDGREVTGWIKVGNNDDKDRLQVTISDSLLPVLPQVLSLSLIHIFPVSPCILRVYGMFYSMLLQAGCSANASYPVSYTHLDVYKRQAQPQGRI